MTVLAPDLHLWKGSCPSHSCSAAAVSVQDIWKSLASSDMLQIICEAGPTISSFTKLFICFLHNLSHVYTIHVIAIIKLVNFFGRLLPCPLSLKQMWFSVLKISAHDKIPLPLLAN